jgi:hypothetical protein
MADARSGLPEWACPNCGDIFTAITEDSLNEKADNHLEDCEVDIQASGDDVTEDAKYSATVKAPRDPEAYEMSEHFHSMYVRRENPSADSGTLEEVIRNGVIKTTHVSGRYLFEHRYDGWLWWIIVDLVDEAFYKPGVNHIAVSLYSPESDEHEQVKKYV